MVTNASAHLVGKYSTIAQWFKIGFNITDSTMLYSCSCQTLYLLQPTSLFAPYWLHQSHSIIQAQSVVFPGAVNLHQATTAGRH